MTVPGATERRPTDPTDPQDPAPAGAAGPCAAGDRRVHVYGFDAPAWTLVLGDDAGVPAIRAVLGDVAAAAVGPTVVFVETDDPAPTGIDPAPGVDVRWVRRAGHSGDGPGLEAAVAAAELPPGAPTIWVSGPSLVERGICRALRDDHGLRVGPLRAVVYRPAPVQARHSSA